VPSHRCYSTSGDTTIQEAGPYKGFRINDGVITYSSGRDAAYRFDVGKAGSPLFKDIPASDVIPFYDPIFPNQQRGLPAFTHALESLKMSLFSTEDERIRQQIISRLHLTIFNEAGHGDDEEPSAIIQNQDGTGFQSKQFPGGVYYMPTDGSRIEQMKHENPGDVWESFQDRIVRDAVAPVWSYSVWKSTGQGTAERGEVLKCRKFIEKRQRDLFIGARRAFAWAYSMLAESGRAPRVQNPLAWDFSRPPRLTVDDGRESKMELDELRTGARNMDEVLGARGLTEDEFFDRRARSVWKRKYTALKVAEELNAANGVEIEVEDREMFMQTQNDMGYTDKADTADSNQDNSQTTQDNE
jgi:capsid protein